METKVKEKIYQIALSRVKGIGYMLSSKLMSRFGSAQAIFQSNLKELVKALGGNRSLAQSILNKEWLHEARELWAAHKNADISIITPWEKAYPNRLRHIASAPVLLYLRGKVDLNRAKVISIVGTRRATAYGKRVVETLLSELRAYPVLVVSGLAYGVDIHAHRTALELGLPTLAVLAGGVDTIYPSAHKKTAESMLAHGGLLGEHPFQTKLEAHQFAARNRIIAGISDATIVVEADPKSGALITAKYASDYNRKVFAVAGSIYEPYSAGCNLLIRTHQAHMLTGAADLIDVMNWSQEIATEKCNPFVQFGLFGLSGLTEIEKGAVQTIGRFQKEMHIDELSIQSRIPLNQLAPILMQLECKKVIRSLPGQKFRLAAC